MQIRESAEMYLETILVLSKRLGTVRAIDIANELSYTKPSVSVAMKNLRENNYATVDEDGGIALTPQGQAVAEAVYKRHVLLSDWLKALGVSEETAVTDACRIEHIISAESVEALRRHVEGYKKKEDR
ncbi:MAG: metal-dependent transcriptional regulator [Clostridiales bacterium]|nr:metal-dependent transcriptional regulator [Clostridiales bacterium]